MNTFSFTSYLLAISIYSSIKHEWLYCWWSFVKEVIALFCVLSLNLRRKKNYVFNFNYNLYRCFFVFFMVGLRFITHKNERERIGMNVLSPCVYNTTSANFNWYQKVTKSKIDSSKQICVVFFISFTFHIVSWRSLL